MMRLLFSLPVFAITALAGFIDTHIHALPPSYQKAVAEAGGDPSGFGTPDWNPQTSIESMNLIGTDIGVLSVSAPGPPIAGTGQKARKLARNINNYLGDLVSDDTYSNYSGRFAMFGALPDFNDVDGTLAELDFLYNKQKIAHGVIVYTAYGSKLLSNETFRPIWDKIDELGVLVFLHPGVLDVTPFLIADVFPQPAVDYPLATTRAAIDLVISGRFTAKSNYNMILSHAGGTLPYLAERTLLVTSVPEVAAVINTTSTKAERAFEKFYLDIALSASPAQLDGVLEFTSPEKVLFGSDSPYASNPGIQLEVGNYETYVKEHAGGNKIRPKVLRENAVRLLGEHEQANSPKIQ